MNTVDSPRDPFEILLGPRSVIVVGASSNPVKYGHLVVRSLVEIGFEGDLFLVNVNREKILDRASYGSVDEVPAPAEAAIIVVPAEHVPGCLRQCGEKGVRLAVIISGGFNELEAEEGDRLYEEMLSIADQYAIRIIGPNTFGTATPAGRFNGSFSTDLSRALPGRITLLSQSGGVSAILGYQAMREGVGLRSVVGLGNRANVEFKDLIRFFGEDDETAVIGLYLEGTERPRELLRAARTVAPRKPILAYKVGSSGAIAGPARSHTGSMAGRYELYQGGLQQAGILWMESPQELMDAAKLFTIQEPIRGPRVAVMSIQAGPAIMLADLCVSFGLELARFSEATRRKIGELLPPKTFLENPVDMGFYWHPPVFVEVAKTLLRDPQVDILIMYTLAAAGPMVEIMRSIALETLPAREPGKILMFGTDMSSYDIMTDLAEIQRAGVPVYLAPERAVRSLVQKLKYERIRRHLLIQQPLAAFGTSS
ncbi:MAG: acetate--CoA ligase family protein [Thermodesulfobacteriota bacterium]